MSTALEAGSRALVYCVQAEDWERVGGFASDVVTSTGDPRLLAELLPHLELAAESAPEGRPRWRCLTILADALKNAGHPDASLPFYEQAATQSRTAAEAGGEIGRQAWADVGVITGNWANALMMNGDLDDARQRHLESAEVSKKAGSPAVNVIRSELEALRIEIMQGRAAEALPQVEARLAQVENWWRQHGAGQPVPEAPDPGFLARVLIGALDIATKAHFAQEDWESALRRIDATLEVKRALERPAEDIAATRMNRANVLRNLDRFPEAKAELEDCLQVFQNDPARRARTLGSLADLFDEQGDVAQAITQQRRALALCELCPIPGPRRLAQQPRQLPRTQRHPVRPRRISPPPARRPRLPARLRAGAGPPDLAAQLRRPLPPRPRRRHELRVPRVAELLADPAFRPLDDWLRQRQADMWQKCRPPSISSWIRPGSWRSNRSNSSSFSYGQRR